MPPRRLRSDHGRSGPRQRRRRALRGSPRRAPRDPRELRASSRAARRDRQLDGRRLEELRDPGRARASHHRERGKDHRRKVDLALERRRAKDRGGAAVPRSDQGETQPRDEGGRLREMINILYIGDVVGQPGRKALHQKLNHVVDREKIDFTIVNIENAAGGFGVTEAIMHELSELPINAYTSGNHIWDKKDFVDNYDRYEHVIRPANYPAGNPGKGRVVRQTAGGVDVAVLQLMGNVFMPPCDNPFHCADRELQELKSVKVIIVDIHGEASSEKQAMGRYLDGRVSAVLGTHTHVPTADERMLPNGTAYQTDVGMTGAYDSVIGFRPEEALHRFLFNTPRKLEVAKRDIRLSGALIEINEESGRASAITRVSERLEE